MENWILAKKIDGEFVKVHQGDAGSKMFIGEDGVMYDISDLDFTVIHPLNTDLLRQLEDSDKRFAEQQAEHQELLNKMLSSMDANAIADHKAKIDEREYWHKLRGDIALEMLHNGHLKGAGINCDYSSLAKKVDTYFTELYNQDKDFFKDK